jgi:hypothetical protein
MRHLSFVPLFVAALGLPVFASVDTALLALVPPGMKVVSGLDFDRARSSEFGQYMTAKIHSNDQDLEHFVSETGFDPRHDLQQILFATSGPAENGNTSKIAILARGNFDSDRITAAAKTKGITPQAFHGVDLFIDKSQHDGPSAFAFLGDGVGVMGDSETVKQIISNRATATALDPALEAAVSKVGSDNDAWFVSMLSGGFLANHINAQINGDSGNHDAKQSMPQTQALQSVLQSTGGIQFGSTIRVSFDAVTRSPQDASSLADVVRFFASMVQMERQKDPRAGVVATAFDNMNLATDGDAMHLSISMPEKGVEQLIDSMPSHGAAGAHATSAHPHAQ